MNSIAGTEHQALSRTVLELDVNNHAGVMSHVVGLFSRRAYNVEGILVMPVGSGVTSRIWLLVNEDERLDQMRMNDWTRWSNRSRSSRMCWQCAGTAPSMKCLCGWRNSFASQGQVCRAGCRMPVGQHAAAARLADLSGGRGGSCRLGAPFSDDFGLVSHDFMTFDDVHKHEVPSLP